MDICHIANIQSSWKSAWPRFLVSYGFQWFPGTALLCSPNMLQPSWVSSLIRRITCCRHPEVVMSKHHGQSIDNRLPAHGYSIRRSLYTSQFQNTAVTQCPFLKIYMFSGMSKSTRLFRLAFQRGLRHAFSLLQIQLRNRCCLMAMRRNSKQTSETEANSTAWEQVGMDVEDVQSSEEEAQTAQPARKSKSNRDKNRPLKPGIRTPIVEASEAYHGGASGAIPRVPSGSNQFNVEQMAQMLQLMRDQGVLPELPVEGQSSQAPKTPRSKDTTETKEKKSGKRQEQAALTGSKADFPTLSTEFSNDVTFNIMNSLRSQGLVFKWKLLLLMLRVKEAVEDPAANPRRRWKRNPRWVMHMHGRHLAALWGHLGAARQLCWNPKTYWLGA